MDNQAEYIPPSLMIELRPSGPHRVVALNMGELRHSADYQHV